MIGAIVVLYNPDWDLLKTGLKALIPQVDEVCIIDNSSTDNSTQFDDVGTVRYVPLLKNMGIAAAQNIGIKYFLNANFDYVIFSDQDSVMPTNIIKKLLHAYKIISTKEEIGAIGPVPINRNNKKKYTIENCIIEKTNIDSISYYITHHVMSSGSIIPLKNFREVGLYNDKLFIDFVESEWCWRASFYHKKKMILITDVEIEHELGHYKKFFGKDINVSSSFRIYFQIRNLLWLKKIEYVPTYWTKLHINKLPFKLLYYSIIPSNRFQYIKRMYKGFKDGLFKSI